MSARLSHAVQTAPVKPKILTINGGSSSIRFALYQAGEPLTQILHGKVDRIGLNGTTLQFNDPAGNDRGSRTLAASDYTTAVRALIEWLDEQEGSADIGAVGHRVVHGMQRSAPARVTDELLNDLRRISRFDPEHLPRELELIEAFRARHPALPQVACFDTAFHRDMPRVAKLLPIPWRYAADGLERYGFHGLSYAYLMEELGRIDPAAAKGRIILAHLGNGASLAAVRDGRSVDTSMGFTPTAGLVMGTRSGDIDPGVAYYLARHGHMTAEELHRVLNQESGLLGVSGSSPDVRDLCAREAVDTRAADAVELFCYQAKKWIGAFAAALGGLNTLVFAGGIGENAPHIRARICAGLGFLGIELHAARNAGNAALISPATGHVKVRVIRTDEELMVARSVSRHLALVPRTGMPH